LVVDDDRQLAIYLTRLLTLEGYEVSQANSMAEASVALRERCPDVALVDLRLPDGGGAELLAEHKSKLPDTAFVIITAYGSIQSAVLCVKEGAVDYLAKPFEPEELFHTIDRALRERAAAAELRLLRSRALATGMAPGPADETQVKSAQAKQMLTQARRAALTDSVVLLRGESGTGKNWLARWLHAQSQRAQGPFFIVNCGAVAPDLAESELFGHEPGAFTGARGRKRGIVELAATGTLVLDEIGAMSLALQAKLLTFMDTRTFVRVGGERSVSVDTRLIACTNAPLEDMVKDGRFRPDLFFRLNVMPITLPPLRERPEDLPQIVAELCATFTSELGLSAPPRITQEALSVLLAYTWPGNIRELRNVLERALILSRDGRITPADLSVVPNEAQWRLMIPFPSGKNIHEVTAEVARELINEALRRGRSKQRAAELLGISRHALAHQIKVLGIAEAKDSGGAEANGSGSTEARHQDRADE
jgi:DNA-binding NtrC family response regulator